MAIAIRKVAEPFGWLGNMSPYAISYGDKEWRTAEALFQAMRFREADIIANIWRQKSPMGAKMVAKKHVDKFVVQPRSVEDVNNMRTILELKITQHPDLKQQLIATGDEFIVEDCSARRNDSGLFWGAALLDGEWIGKNVLGTLWMELRKKIQAD